MSHHWHCFEPIVLIKPEWSLLAYVDGVPVGFVIGDIDLTLDPPGGHIYQIGVVPAQRRRGLGSALLVETMRRMQVAGAASARLEVHVNNPGALQAFAGLGFVTIGRRARYERIVKQLMGSMIMSPYMLGEEY